MASPWHPEGWRALPVKQQPIYPDMEKLESALTEVRRLPPLVTPREVEDLRAQLAEVACGKRFLLQGGDCAERFQDCCSESIEKQLRILLQMSLVLTWGARVPTLRVARMAGQFAKPRSKDTEVVDGVEVAAFRGDNVNSFDDLSARTPDPARLVSGYFHSAASLNYARAALASGLADLKSSSQWDLGFVQDPAHRAQYNEILDRILSSLDFMRVCGVVDEVALRTASVFMSHEGLQLNYESALTRPVASSNSGGGGGKIAAASPPFQSPPRPTVSSATAAAAAAAALVSGDAPAAVVGKLEYGSPSGRESSSTTPLVSPTTAAAAGGAAAVAAEVGAATGSPSAAPASPPLAYYNLGTHFLWIGDRTRQLDHAHVEYFRGIENPIGVKAGPSSDPGELVEVIRRLWPNPAAKPGKIVIITRLGAQGVKTALPKLITAVRDAAFSSPVVWVCDPMHGNGKVSSSGLKTREFDDILTELK